MQPATGQTFSLPETRATSHVGARVDLAELEAMRDLAADDAAKREVEAAIESVSADGPLVGVSAEAAQKVRLGERELERRRRRNKAAKQARKRGR